MPVKFKNHSMKISLKYSFGICLIIGVLMLLSCKTNSTQLQENNGLEELIIKSLNQKPIYISKLLDDSTYVVIYGNQTNDNMPYFFSDTLNQIFAAKYEPKSNRMQKPELIMQDDYTYLDIDSASFRTTNVDGIIYIYFSSHESFMGQAVLEQTVSFYLIDVNNLSHFELSYVGEPSFKCDDCIEGDFEIDAKLKKNPRVLSYLMQQSRQSKEIYHASTAEKDPMNSLNYEEKWNEDNSQDNSFGVGNAEINTPIKTTYYKTKLLDLNDGSAVSIENDDYIVFTFFRGNLIGFDKRKELYFPIIIESCSLGCSKETEFVGDSLEIRYESDITYRISMNDLEFDKRIGL